MVCLLEEGISFFSPLCLYAKTPPKAKSVFHFEDSAGLFLSVCHPFHEFTPAGILASPLYCMVEVVGAADPARDQAALRLPQGLGDCLVLLRYGGFDASPHCWFLLCL